MKIYKINVPNKAVKGDINISGAKKIILNIVSGGGDNEMSTLELNTITKLANKSSSENVEIIFGTAIDGELGDSVRVTIIATGFNNNDHEINEVIDSDEKIEEKSQFSLFDKSDIEFIPNDNQEEVVHNMDDDYDECEDTFENDDKEIETNDRSEDVVIDELDGYDDNEVDHS